MRWPRRGYRGRSAVGIRVVAVIVALAFPATSLGGTVFLLDGRGWGHGVGMSQWGAEGYARHGYGYRKILAHYYSQTHVAIAQPRQVRVLLVQGQPTVRVGSAAPFLVVDARGRKLHLPARAVVVDRRFLLRHKHLAAPIRFEPGIQPLRLGDAGYRGALVVRPAQGGLMVINVLPLDRYLRGVVPWEVPKGWHEATYEAQAVAARSYTLATVHPAKNFDLFSDQRSQLYGGIRAERPQTNLAIGATAGQVLVWHDRIIPAFYFSSSGGRTSSVHDAWPRAQQVPYLVSVADPYDYISPHHVWPTSALSVAQVASVLRVRGVRDVRVVNNSSGRAQAVRVLTASGWKAFPSDVVRKRFSLGSTDFEVRVMSLDAPSSLAVFGDRVQVHGWVRGLGTGPVADTQAERLAGVLAYPSDSRRAVHGHDSCPALDAAPARLQRDRGRRGCARRDAAAGCPRGRDEASSTRFAAPTVRGPATDAADLEAGRPRNGKLRPHHAARQLSRHGGGRPRLRILRFAASRPARAGMISVASPPVGESCT